MSELPFDGGFIGVFLIIPQLSETYQVGVVRGWGVYFLIYCFQIGVGEGSRNVHEQLKKKIIINIIFSWKSMLKKAFSLNQWNHFESLFNGLMSKYNKYLLLFLREGQPDPFINLIFISCTKKHYLHYLRKDYNPCENCQSLVWLFLPYWHKV
jgi:hypothetical protein